MPLRLLCVTAHPDDECFAFGGALALAAQRGAETSVLCLTDGQAGTHRPANATNADLGNLRRAEFAASCNLLGVHHHEMLNYQDAHLEFATLSALASDIVQRIRLLRPHVLLTFGGDGALNTHPDHTAVSAAATAAFHWSGSPKRFPTLGDPHQPQRLYYLTNDFFLPNRRRPLPTPWTLTLDIRPVFAIKVAALAAHTSQAPLLDQVRPLFQRHGQQERYALAATRTPQPATQSTDLFNSITT